MGAFNLVTSGVEGLGEGCVWSPVQDPIMFPKACEKKKKRALCLGGRVEDSP